MAESNGKKKRALKIIAESEIALTTDELMERYEALYKESYSTLLYDFDVDRKNVVRAEDAINDYNQKRGKGATPFRPKWNTRLFYTDKRQLYAWVEKNHPELRRKKL
jgi:hypothetical protein